MRSVFSRGVSPLAILNLTVADLNWRVVVGWSSVQPAQQFNSQYDNTGFGDQGGPSVKSRLTNLIGAVRTLLRSKFIVSVIPAWR